MQSQRGQVLYTTGLRECERDKEGGREGDLLSIVFLLMVLFVSVRENQARTPCARARACVKTSEIAIARVHAKPIFVYYLAERREEEREREKGGEGEGESE